MNPQRGRRRRPPRTRQPRTRPRPPPGTAHASKAWAARPAHTPAPTPQTLSRPSSQRRPLRSQHARQPPGHADNRCTNPGCALRPPGPRTTYPDPANCRQGRTGRGRVLAPPPRGHTRGGHPRAVDAPVACSTYWWGVTWLYPGWVPDAGGSAEPPAEGVNTDTSGPDQASDRVQQLAHLPGLAHRPPAGPLPRVPAGLDVPVSRPLRHGHHPPQRALRLTRVAPSAATTSQVEERDNQVHQGL